MLGPSSDRLVNGSDGSVRQGLLVAGQEAKIRDEGSPEKSKSEVRSNLHLQKYRIRVSSLNLMQLIPVQHCEHKICSITNTKLKYSISATVNPTTFFHS